MSIKLNIKEPREHIFKTLDQLRKISRTADTEPNYNPTAYEIAIIDYLSYLHEEVINFVEELKK